MTLITNILITTTLLSGTILASTLVSADNDSVVDEINITVPVSCTLSGTGMNTHNANINNGQYDSAIGETTMKAFCNDNNGFAIYAIGYTDDTDGNNILTSSTLGSEHDIVTGTAISGDTSNWAMKLSTISSPTPTYPIVIAGSTDDTEKEQGDPDYTTFQEVPDDYVLVAKRTAGTDIGTNAEGTTLKSTYQAYISKTQPAGTYTGQVKYTLIHPHNAAAPVSPISIEKAYEKNGKQKYNGYYKMQEMSDSICSIVTLYDEASQTQLIDIRDNKTYYVAKLQDGNCWMTQNLDHDIVTNGTVVYDNTTTDLGWNGTSYSTASWTPVSATRAMSDTTWDTGSTGNTSPESYDPGELYWNGTTTSDYQSNQTSSTGDSHYHLGNYYNWTAAVAMNDSSSYTTNNQDVNQSICPSGWTLPKIGSNTASGSFQYLSEQYGWDSSSYMMTNPYIWNTAIKLPLSGGWYGSLENVGNLGDFWSPVVYDSELSYGVYAYYGGYVNPGGLSDRTNGLPVRCVVR